mmetsp:Transcript_13340/g.47085  ORF Transcript_13340/g.47085 Transcript_13340/m.47085 type:complete len:275 (+) Transcript_13340:290-1114(+)
MRTQRPRPGPAYSPIGTHVFTSRTIWAESALGSAGHLISPAQPQGTRTFAIEACICCLSSTSGGMRDVPHIAARLRPPLSATPLMYLSDPDLEASPHDLCISPLRAPLHSIVEGDHGRWVVRALPDKSSREGSRPRAVVDHGGVDELLHGLLNVQEGRSLRGKEPLVAVADIEVGLQCREVQRDVPWSMRPVDQYQSTGLVANGGKFLDWQHQTRSGGDVRKGAETNLLLVAPHCSFHLRDDGSSRDVRHQRRDIDLHQRRLEPRAGRLVAPLA